MTATIPTDFETLKRMAKEFFDAVKLEPPLTRNELENIYKAFNLGYLGYRSTATIKMMKDAEDYQSKIVWKMVADKYLDLTLSDKEKP